MIIKLTQVDDNNDPTKPIWISVLSIMGFETTKSGITMIRFGGVVCFVKETPERISELINEVQDVAQRRSIV